VIKSGAVGERGAIGLFGGAGSAGFSSVERVDPEGVRPRRGAEAGWKLAAAGLKRQQRVAGVDTDRTGEIQDVGGEAQRPNGLFDNPAER
jgi:hypothetical protein